MDTNGIYCHVWGAFIPFPQVCFDRLFSVNTNCKCVLWKHGPIAQDLHANLNRRQGTTSRYPSLPVPQQTQGRRTWNLIKFDTCQCTHLDLQKLPCSILNHQMWHFSTVLDHGDCVSPQQQSSLGTTKTGHQNPVTPINPRKHIKMISMLCVCFFVLPDDIQISQRS